MASLKRKRAFLYYGQAMLCYFFIAAAVSVFISVLFLRF